MKKIFLMSLFVLVGMSFHHTNAQQANRVLRGQRGYTPPPKADGSAFIELKDPHYEVEIMLPKCVEEFKLDAFEKEIMKVMLFKKIEDQNKILEEEGNSREDRRKKIIALNKNFHSDLASILTKEEIDHFKIMDFSETREEKKKKKKRRKRNKGKS